MAKGRRDHAQGETPGAARTPSEGGAKADAHAPAAWTPLVDWSEVFPGNRGVNRHGVYDLYDAPIGIELEVELADKSEPLIVADREWEGYGQLVPLAYWEANDRYHMLYRAYDRRSAGDKSASALGGGRTCTCYAVSDDADRWSKPELGYVDYEGSTANNIIPTDIAGSPFQDPSAPADERFRVMGQEGHSVDAETGEEISSEEAGRRFRAMEEDPSYDGPRVKSEHWIAGWTSPDGIHWKRIERHLADMPSDGGNAAQYDSDTGSYFAYLRVGAMGRRAIGLSRTDSFWSWPAPELVLAPDPQDDPEISFYTANYFRYPGQQSLHGMVLSVYHQRTDHMDHQLAFSRNGTHWVRPERRAVIPVGGAGSGEEGITRVALTGLSFLPDGTWAALYEGSSMLHNATGFIEVPPGQFRWARWQPNRLCGILADDVGELTVPTVTRSRNQLRLNYRCSFGGWIAVELIPSVPSRVHPDMQAIPGFSFAEAGRLYGDQSEAVVSWGGKSDTRRAGDQFALRVRMFQAKLFAYSA